MITLAWWQLVLFILANHIAIQLCGAVIATIKDYRRTCPRKRVLPISGVEVRCFKRLDHGECPDHGLVR